MSAAGQAERLDAVTFSYLLLQATVRGPFPQRASVTEDTAVTARVCPDTLPHPECDPHYGKRLSSNLHVLISTHARTLALSHLNRASTALERTVNN